MKNQSLTAALIVCACASITQAQTPLGTGFTYQGQLKASGLPTVANADFQVSLYDSLNSGTQIGSTVAKDNVALVNGAFTISLDFGAVAFQGDARWLEVSVRSPAGGGGFTTLAPRQLLTATPNATYSLTTRGIAVDANGQVGIGTAAPATELHVSGEVPALRVQDNDDPASFLLVEHSQPGQMSLNNVASTGISLMDLNPMTLDGTGNAHLRLFRHTNTTGVKSVIFHSGNNTNATSAVIGVGGSSSIFQLDGGNFGIGTSAPEARLHVLGGTQLVGDTQIQGGLDVKRNGFGANTFRDSQGRVHFRLTVSVDEDHPTFRMISPITGDSQAGMFRSITDDNGVLFADEKNFRAPNPADVTTDIWYCCPEGPEAAMYVRGTGRLTDGRAVIELPDHFRNLASEPGMTVQLTPLSGESKGMAAVKKRLDGIEVIELSGGTGNYEFDWRVEAVRKGWEDYKVIRPWLRSDDDPDKAWQNRLKHIEERRAHGKPSPVLSADTSRPSN